MLVKYKAFSILTVISKLDIQFYLLGKKKRSSILGEQLSLPEVIVETRFKNCMERHCFYEECSHVCG